jgi:hypothetical protein
LNDALGVLEAFLGVEVLDEQYPMRLEKSVPLMVVYGPRGGMERLAIDFRDSPFAFMANQEIALQILSAFGAVNRHSYEILFRQTISFSDSTFPRRGVW